MGNRDPRVDAYIAGAAPFARPILKHLRAIVHAGCPGVVETLKWSMPHFEYKGMFCGMAAFKAHCVFGFWHHKLLEQRLSLGRRSPKDAMGSFGCLTTLADLPSKATLLRVVKAAAALNDAGIKPARVPKKKRAPLPTPAYFLAAVRRNKKALATFEGFSPTNKREYVEWVTEARTDETRRRRLETSVGWMAEGKTRNWKYVRR